LIPAGLLVARVPGAAPAVQPAGPAPIDRDATAETRALFANLRRVAREHVLFGHKTIWRTACCGPANRDGRCEGDRGLVPAVYGWDAGGLERDAARPGRRRVRPAARLDRGGFARGGVVTLSWHMRNPVTAATPGYDRRAGAILPGGPQHERYTRWLDRFADYVKSLRAQMRQRAGGDVLVPVVFRPFHETTAAGSGGGAARDAGRVRGCGALRWNPARPQRRAQPVVGVFDRRVRLAGAVSRRYPGDAWVDVLGFETTRRAHSATRAVFARRLRDVWSWRRRAGRLRR